MAIIRFILMGFEFLMELWPFVKDAVTESPEEFRASLQEIGASMKAASHIPWKERREKYREAARALSKSVERGG